MLVTEKLRDIAILRTQARPVPIVALFLAQGLLIGTPRRCARHLRRRLGRPGGATVAAFVENLLGVDLINADVYFIDYLPAELRLGDVARVALAALGLALLATLYPAWRAAHVDPAQAVHQD